MPVDLAPGDIPVPVEERREVLVVDEAMLKDVELAQVDEDVIGRSERPVGLGGRNGRRDGDCEKTGHDDGDDADPRVMNESHDVSSLFDPPDSAEPLTWPSADRLAT